MKKGTPLIGPSNSQSVFRTDAGGYYLKNYRAPAYNRQADHVQPEAHNFASPISSFSPKIYDRVDQYLDEQGLDIISPAIAFRRRITTLKPCLLVTQLVNPTDPRPILDTDPESTIPSLLLRRAIPYATIHRVGQPTVDPADCHKMKRKLFAHLLSDVSTSS